MTEDEMRTLRLLIREETNAAVYASEERMGSHFRRLEGHMDLLAGRMGQFEGHMDLLAGRMGQFEGHMDLLAGRMGQFEGHMDLLAGRMGQLEGHMDLLEERMGRFEVRLDRIEIEQGEIRVTMVKLETNLSKTISVLDDVTRVINDLQASQRALELKLDDNLVGMRKDIQRINESLHSFAHEFITMHVQTNERITWHERTPMSETHPKPHSAA